MISNPYSKLLLRLSVPPLSILAAQSTIQMNHDLRLGKGDQVAM